MKNIKYNQYSNCKVDRHIDCEVCSSMSFHYGTSYSGHRWVPDETNEHRDLRYSINRIVIDDIGRFVIPTYPAIHNTSMPYWVKDSYESLLSSKNSLLLHLTKNIFSTKFHSKLVKMIQSDYGSGVNLGKTNKFNFNVKKAILETMKEDKDFAEEFELKDKLYIRFINIFALYPNIKYKIKIRKLRKLLKREFNNSLA